MKTALDYLNDLLFKQPTRDELDQNYCHLSRLSIEVFLSSTAKSFFEVCEKPFPDNVVDAFVEVAKRYATFLRDKTSSTACDLTADRDFYLLSELIDNREFIADERASVKLLETFVDYGIRNRDDMTMIWDMDTFCGCQSLDYANGIERIINSDKLWNGGDLYIKLFEHIGRGLKNSSNHEITRSARFCLMQKALEYRKNSCWLFPVFGEPEDEKYLKSIEAPYGGLLIDHPITKGFYEKANESNSYHPDVPFLADH